MDTDVSVSCRTHCCVSAPPFTMHTRHNILPTITVLLAASLVLFVAGCDFLDPVSVENPRTTDEDLEQATEPVVALVPGVKAQFARAVGSTVVATEVATDNYSINGTGLGGNDMDFPTRITPNTAVMNSVGATLGSYWNLQELAALASFVIDDIAPGDESATDAMLAEVHYYRGMARLMQAENYAAVPTSEESGPVPASELYDLASDDLQTALDLDPSGAFSLPAEAALARLHRGQGNASAAASFAESVLSADPAFLFQQGYDAQNQVNPAHLYLVTRALKELQPLPRLDFLDPKYTSRDAGIAVAKAEEMHLILAEVALAAGQPDEAKSQLQLARTVAEERATADFNDGDARLDNDLNPRPRTSDIKIAFEPGAPFAEGLVLDRPGLIQTPSVSATSVSEDQINAATGTELIRLFYQMRQEILLLEGRRVHDLGIRLPMMLREIEQTPNVSPGDLGTETIIPSYIPPANEMDLYTPVEIYEEQEDGDGNAIFVTIEDEITMLHDMNRILAEERGLVMQNPRLP